MQVKKIQYGTNIDTYEDLLTLLLHSHYLVGLGCRDLYRESCCRVYQWQMLKMRRSTPVCAS